VASQAFSGRLAAASLPMPDSTYAGLDRWLSTGIRLCSEGLMTRSTWQGGNGGGGSGTLLGATWNCCLGWKLVRAVGREARYLRKCGVWNKRIPKNRQAGHVSDLRAQRIIFHCAESRPTLTPYSPCLTYIASRRPAVSAESRSHQLVNTMSSSWALIWGREPVT
jgi:hypothetical protein